MENKPTFFACSTTETEITEADEGFFVAEAGATVVAVHLPALLQFLRACRDGVPHASDLRLSR